MKPHKSISLAIDALSEARRQFIVAKEKGLVLGNDNHIGDIGEYWVMQLLTKEGKFKEYAPKKNSSFDIELTDGTLVSVKTITAWAEGGKGTQIKPLCGTKWSVLAAVYLNEKLRPAKISMVSIGDILRHEPFVSNAQRRANGTRAYPRFEWWSWLDDYLVYTST